MRRILLFLSAWLCLGTVAFAQTGGASYALPTWEGAMVYLPRKALNKDDQTGIGRMSDPAIRSELSKAKPTPIMLFMHGCGGFDNPNYNYYGRWLSSLGYIVVMPDSMARKYRPFSCDRGWGPTSYLYRQEEIVYALSRLEKETWADVSRMILIGQSEGGHAAAVWGSGGFLAQVAMGYSCQDPYNPAIKATKETPVLVVVAEEDRHIRSAKACERYLVNPKSKLIAIEGKTHHPALQAPVRREVTDFIRSVDHGG